MKDKKVVLRKWWKDEPENANSIVSKPNARMLDEFINIELIMVRLLEKVIKGNAIKDLKKRIEHHKLLRIEIQNQLADTKVYFSPLMSEDNFNSICSINKYIISHLDTKINLFEEEIIIRDNSKKENSDVPIQIAKAGENSDESKMAESNETKIQLKNADEELMSRKEVAAHFKISQGTLTAWMKEGIVPYSRPKKRVFFKSKDIFALSDSRFKGKRASRSQ